MIACTQTTAPLALRPYQQQALDAITAIVGDWYD